MNRTDRLVAMVMYFQGRRLVRAEELAEHFGISVRTVYRDVAALGESGVPITGEAGVGYSLVKGYHLPPVMFTREEALALFVGGEMVKQFTDASMVEPMRSSLLKLRAVLPREQQDDVDRLARAMVVSGRGSLGQGLDQKVLLPVHQAIVSRRVLKLGYRARGRDEPTERRVEPLGVIFYGAAWYLVGWCRLRDALREFKLGRIVDLEITAERFVPRPEFSLAKHLERSMGTAGGIQVRVWFSASAVERARQESCSGLVETLSSRGGMEVTLSTFSIDWFARWILSYGDEAEALEPPELRDRIQQLARRVVERHDDATGARDRTDLAPESEALMRS